MIIVNGGSAVIKNNKTVEDTYSTKAIVDSISSSVQMKQVMVQQTPGRYMLKSMMAGFLLSIVTVLCLVLKHNSQVHMLMVSLI